MEKRKFQPRRVLSLKERIEVIKIAGTLRDTRELARRFDCGRTQILSILQQKERLLREWTNDGDPNRLRRRPSVFSVSINKMIAEWISRCRCMKLPISDRMIIDKAYLAKKFFKYTEFRPNRRWLDRFKRRFRLDDIDLETPDPSFADGPEKSLKLSDIYEDIKDSLDTDIIESMEKRQSSPEYKLFLNSENNTCSSPVDSLKEQTLGSNNEASDSIEDNDLSWQLGSICETEIQDESSDPIKDDAEALACIKKLEEYSMLKENFRAIGLIEQLEKIYKGELEA